jgi:hypothetical protein
VTALVESFHRADAHLLLRGTGNARGKALGVAHVLSRALPRRKANPGDPSGDLEEAFASEREELRALIDRAAFPGRPRRGRRGRHEVAEEPLLVPAQPAQPCPAEDRCPAA